MILRQPVSKGRNIRGFATIDTNNKDTFWITYVDYELCCKLNKIVLFNNVPYPRHGGCDFDFGPISTNTNNYERTSFKH